MDAALSGGPDSTALVALAVAAGLRVTAHHVDHHLRADSGADADSAAATAHRLGVVFVRHDVHVVPGPNLEARARAARRSVLPADAMTGHTADDQAETVVLALLRGAGGDGLAGMRPGPRHPLLALRRHETRELCAALDLPTVSDPTNVDPVHRRNRVRAEVLPLLDAVADRDVTPLLVRAANLLRDEGDLLDELASQLDPTDARALAAAPRPLARRALRRWLARDGYPPDAAAIERVMAVATGRCVACEIDGGRRVERSHGRLRVVVPGG